MAKLSVIMCVYNTDEKFVEEALNSVFSGVEKDLEVIMVDDGSTKDYTSLLKKFPKLIYHKTKNAGTLKARIFGAKQATSDYVCYIDSDDTVSEFYHKAMIERAEQSGADVVVNDWAFHTENTKYYCRRDTTIKNDICYEGEVILNRFMEQRGLQHSFYVLWNKIYNRELLLSALAEVEKLETGRMLFAEDLLISFFVSTLAKKMVNVHLGFYFYRIHGSQQIAADTKEKIEHQIESQTFVFDVMKKKLEKLGVFETYENYFKNWKELLCFNNYCYAKRAGCKELYPLIKERYGFKKIKKHFAGASKFYDHQKVLPLNIEEVDQAVKKIYYSNKYLKIYAKRGSYGFAQAYSLVPVFGRKLAFVSRKSKATFVMPKEKVLLRQKILHNTLVYKIGIVLFPKGSRLRKLLKSKL